MPFSTLVKDELARLWPEKDCCRRAEMSALLHTAGSLHVTGPHDLSLQTTTEHPAVARQIYRLASELHDLRVEVTVRRSVLHKTTNYLVNLSSHPRLPQVLKDIGLLAEHRGLVPGVSKSLVNKRCCSLAYLRGAFLAGGFVSNPNGSYHLELATGNKALADDLKALFQKFELPAGVAERRSSWVVYLKESGKIAEYLALVGAHSALLKWEDARTVKEVRGYVNRLVNCDTANAGKAVRAAVQQLEDLTRIDEEIGLSKLPRSLRDFAEARLANPEASLRELGESMTPPLSKVAVAHRARRIGILAKRLEIARPRG